MNHTKPAAHAPTETAQTDEKLTIPEVCAELKVSRSTFYYWRQTGRAPQCIILPNREVRITRNDLHTWLTAHTEQDTPEQDHHQ
ncbi:MAG: helix-turn-helix transcriptional regulator [Nocardioides sp.]